MIEALRELTKEQIDFICQECKITENELNSLNDDELYDKVYDVMCDIECAEVPRDGEEESERCAIASDIVTLLGNTLEQCDDEDEDD